MIREDRPLQPDAERVLTVRRQRGWDGMYFGGVTFTYQRPVSDLATATKIAYEYMDIVTTSGPGTGQPASPDKIRSMKEALGDSPLAIASGITLENVADYLPWADCFLVATGISRSFEELEPECVQALVDFVHSFKS